MKTLVRHHRKGGAGHSSRKDSVLRFRVDPRQRSYWYAAIKELKVEDFSSYAREAIDRAIAQDLQANDPKWQAFIKAIQPKAQEILGMGLKDDAKARVEFSNEIEKARRHKAD